MSIKDRVVSAGICIDKSRLHRDLSTQHIAIEVHAQLIEDLWVEKAKKAKKEETEEIDGETLGCDT